MSNSPSPKTRAAGVFCQLNLQLRHEKRLSLSLCLCGFVLGFTLYRLWQFPKALSFFPMAPSGRSRRKVTPRTRRTHPKKKQQQLVKPKIVQEELAVDPSCTATSKSHASDCSKTGAFDFESSDDIASSACSTPKAQRFRIPEVATCPPAPMKKRMIPNRSLQRRPIAFFAPPDLELFFFFAL